MIAAHGSFIVSMSIETYFMRTKQNQKKEKVYFDVYN